MSKPQRPAAPDEATAAVVAEAIATAVVDAPVVVEAAAPAATSIQVTSNDEVQTFSAPVVESVTTQINGTTIETFVGVYVPPNASTAPVTVEGPAE